MAEARFAAGDRVRVRAEDPAGHTRVPRYVRGHTGRILQTQGRWPLADDLAAARTRPRVETVYTVCFSASELFGAAGHDVTVDLWESYLEGVE